MSVREPDYAAEVGQILLQYASYASAGAELTAITAALGSDTTTHDRTIETPLAALRIGADKTPFTNDILLCVNKGKGGNLTSSQLIAGIQDATGVVHAPTNTQVPFASITGSAIVGAPCTVTKGTWTGSPTNYTYQWKRDGTTNIGTTNATVPGYALVAGDIGGHAITCVVTAQNGQGSTAGPPSNAIAT